MDYDAIFQSIAEKIYALLPDGYLLEIEQERQFVRRKTFTPKTIYLCVSFATASFNPWQTYSKITILAVSEENCFDATRALLSGFAAKYNLTTEGDFLFSWDMPVMSQQFNEIAAGFRATFAMAGSVLANTGGVGTVDSLVYVASGGDEEISFLTFNDAYTASLAPQAFPNGNGFALSETRYGTYGFTISAYLDASTEFGKAVLKAKYEADSTPFEFKLTIAGTEYGLSDMRLTSAQMTRNIGQLPAVSIGFSR